MALSITEPTIELAFTTNVTSYALGGFTPTANSLLICMVFATGTVAAGTMTGGGLTWTLQKSQLYNTTDTAYLFTAQVTGTPTLTAATFDCAADAATGCVMMLFQVTGHSQRLPIRQSVSGSGATANPSLIVATRLTGNAYVAGFGIPRSPPASAGPTGWTEIADIGYATPTAGAVGAFRVNGETGTTVTFTSVAGNWGMLFAEVQEAYTPIVYNISQAVNRASTF